MAAPSMTGRTVFITGGTAEIGRAAAIGLASMGARVGITGRDRTRGAVGVADVVEADPGDVGSGDRASAGLENLV